MKISVVAGGYSFGEVDHTKIPHPVIAVNDALLYLETEIEFALSMDRLWTEGRWQILHDRGVPAFIRKAALKRVAWEGCDWLFPFDCNYQTAEFSNQIEVLNGGNSGHCALNLAYTMKPTELYLFGFDMQPGPKGQRRWYPLADWERERNYNGTKGYKFSSWIRDMGVAARYFEHIRCRVYNVSARSLITEVFEKKTPQELGMAK